MQMEVKDNCLWFLKSIIKLREKVNNMQQWEDMDNKEKFHIRKLYKNFLDCNQHVD